MKALILAALLCLSGCASMTQGQKQTAAIIGGIAAAVVVVSASQDDDDSNSPSQRCTTVIGPNGNDRSCQ